MNVVAGIFMITGSLLTMIGGIGVVRFRDLMSRVHAAAKAPTLGLMLMAVGAAIEIGTFTGYSALCIASGLPDDGQLICCDVSDEWTKVGVPFWKNGISGCGK